MKPIVITLAIIAVVNCASFGKIKNGYGSEINSALTSLRILDELLAAQEKLTHTERRAAEKRIKEVSEYILYYELTEQLLLRFRTIAPEIYNTIDSLRDGKGRPTDVYIRFIPEKNARVQAWGITNIGRMTDDPHGYRSEFGEYTVSVKVWAVEKSLLVLAHELGHVKYQVGHLASYVEYYNTTYPRATTEPNYIGHAHGDQSGDSALAFEKKFRERHARYWKEGGVLESPLVLRERINDEIRQSRTVAAKNM